jgi:uracil-DNA glycosylase family 4
MNRDVLGEIRRYFLNRQSSGLDVAYRIEETEREGATPRRSEREIVMLTSPVAMESERAAGGAPASREGIGDNASVPASGSSAGPSRGGASERPEAKPSIRVTTDQRPASQGALFAEPDKTERFDLSRFDLAALEEAVSSCRRCSLCAGRTQTVFGSGNAASKIVFVGEAPGREEDLQGLPFVGRAGQLLTKILAAMGFARDEVYITNILKCRPPGNREPQEDEMHACEPYLARQLELIEPAIICALGRIAGHGLLKKGAALSVLRQGVHYYNDIKVAVTYHPAALLRNPNLKRDAWEDFQMVRRLYDEAIGEDA